jgi:hypothetical protein
MRTLAVAALLVLCFSAPAAAYGPFQPQVIGPYQPNPFGGYVYISPYRNPYYGRVAPGYGGRGRAYGRGFDDGYAEGVFLSRPVRRTVR